MTRNNIHPFVQVMMDERAAWGLTQEELGTLIGRSATIVSDMETGRTAVQQKLLNLMAALDLFGYELRLVKRELTDEERKTIEAARGAHDVQ